MKWGKVTLVIVGAVIITALGIDAADTLTGSKGTLLSQVIRTSDGCPKGMVRVQTVGTLSCVDVYEASLGDDCSNQNPTNMVLSRRNVEEASCFAESKEGATPWRFITREQAMHMCAKSGKRLPTSEEWYKLSIGTEDTESTCNISSGSIAETGSYSGCRAPLGIFDMVGNVWEWTSDDVIEGMYSGRTLPESGYVTQVDTSGMATVSSSTEQDLFGKDYFWSKAEGAFGVIRGGFYDSGTDAGVYIVHADTPPNTAGTGIGFRCVK